MQLALGVVTAENFALAAAARCLYEATKCAWILLVGDTLPFKCLLLHGEEGVGGEACADSDAVSVTGLDEVAANVLAHPFAQCMCIVDGVQEVGIACGLCVARPVEGQPIGDSVMEVLQEGTAAVKSLQQHRHKLLAARQRRGILRVRGQGSEPRAHCLRVGRHTDNAREGLVEGHGSGDASAILNDQRVPVILATSGVEPPVAREEGETVFRAAECAVDLFFR